MFIWENFHPGYRDLGNRAIPVNRDHMKRPLEVRCTARTEVSGSVSGLFLR